MVSGGEKRQKVQIANFRSELIRRQESGRRQGSIIDGLVNYFEMSYMHITCFSDRIGYTHFEEVYFEWI